MVVLGGAAGAVMFNPSANADDTSDDDEFGTDAPDSGEPDTGGPDPHHPGVGELANTAIVRVEPGFVDATSWRDDLFTLRQGPAGMLLRSETAARDHVVSVSDGFAGRCLGVHENLLVIGGHRLVQTGTTTFEAGTPYETLLAQAGHESKALLAQPERPIVRPHRHIFVERFPSLLVTEDLRQ